MGDNLPYEVSSQKSIKRGDVDSKKVRILGEILAGKSVGRGIVFKDRIGGVPYNRKTVHSPLP